MSITVNKFFIWFRFYYWNLFAFCDCRFTNVFSLLSQMLLVRDLFLIPWCIYNLEENLWINEIRKDVDLKHSKKYHNGKEEIYLRPFIPIFNYMKFKCWRKERSFFSVAYWGYKKFQKKNVEKIFKFTSLLTKLKK